MVRRDLLRSVIGLTGSLVLTRSATAAAGTSKFRAIAFDAFPIFDPRSIAARCEALFPGRGGEFVQTWRSRQFEYTWLRTAAGRYADFERVTAELLAFAADALKLDLTAGKREQLLQAHFELKTWPDVIPALTRLRDAGLPLVFLSNFTPRMLNSCIKYAGLDGVFDAVLSTDLAQTYKPDSRAYALGEVALTLPRDRILYGAFAGWDATGANVRVSPSGSIGSGFRRSDLVRCPTPRAPILAPCPLTPVELSTLPWAGPVGWACPCAPRGRAARMGTAGYAVAHPTDRVLSTPLSRIRREAGDGRRNSGSSALSAGWPPRCAASSRAHRRPRRRPS